MMALVEYALFEKYSQAEHDLLLYLGHRSSGNRLASKSVLI